MTQKPQYNHSNNLLPAESTNVKISTIDVDSLLTPLAGSTSPRLSNNDWQRNMDQRPERNLWRIEEIMEMLNTMQELHALELLNDKTVKSETVFREVELEMNKKGYCKKSHVQIWTKWKFLKSTYTTSKRAGIIPKMISPQVFDMLHKMLTNNNALLMSRSQSSLRTDISESGNSLASNNDDSDNSSRIIISGVESNYNMSQQQNQKDTEDESGLAHPIFGFRLEGVVKQEPIDNGYDAVQDSNIEPEVQASTTNLKFRTNIKQEPVPPLSHLQNDHNFIIKNHLTRKSSSIQNSVNVNKISCSAQSTKNNLPILRIAPFAKDPKPIPHQGETDLNNELRISSVRTTSTSELNASSYAKSYQPQNSGMETRFAKKLSTNCTQLRLKHTPLRKTPIPERMDHDSPKHYNEHDSDVEYFPYKHRPNTSHKLKKRSHDSKIEEEYGKKRKFDTKKHIDANDSFEDDDSLSNNLIFNSSSMPRKKSTTKIESLFSNLLKAFQKSLYNLQHEMMNQFIINQMQLVRKEHEFQMKQDSVMMATMKKQSEDFLANAKKIFCIEVNDHNNYKKRETGEKACQTNTEILEKFGCERNAKDTNDLNKEHKNIFLTNFSTTEQNKELKQVLILDKEKTKSETLQEISPNSDACKPEVRVLQVKEQPLVNIDGAHHFEQTIEQMNQKYVNQQNDNDIEQEGEENGDYAINEDPCLRPISDMLHCSLDF